MKIFQNKSRFYQLCRLHHLIEKNKFHFFSTTELITNFKPFLRISGARPEIGFVNAVSIADLSSVISFTTLESVFFQTSSKIAHIYIIF